MKGENEKSQGAKNIKSLKPATNCLIVVSINLNKKRAQVGITITSILMLKFDLLNNKLGH